MHQSMSISRVILATLAVFVAACKSHPPVHLPSGATQTGAGRTFGLFDATPVRSRQETYVALRHLLDNSARTPVFTLIFPDEYGAQWLDHDLAAPEMALLEALVAAGFHGPLWARGPMSAPGMAPNIAYWIKVDTVVADIEVSDDKGSIALRIDWVLSMNHILHVFGESFGVYAIVATADAERARDALAADPVIGDCITRGSVGIWR